MKYFLVIIAALALTGCVSTATSQAPQVRVQEVPVGPPDSLLTCRVQPPAPRGEYTQADVARYIVRLQEAGADCRDKLNEVRRWVEREVR